MLMVFKKDSLVGTINKRINNNIPPLEFEELLSRFPISSRNELVTYLVNDMAHYQISTLPDEIKVLIPAS